MSETRLLILGGYGTFGGRLAQLLAGEPRLTLLIAGCSRHKAEAFCAGPRDGKRSPSIAMAMPKRRSRPRSPTSSSMRPARFNSTRATPIGW